MKLLVIGANGFIGKKVAEHAKLGGFEVFCASFDIDNAKNNRKLDLSDKNSIKSVLLEIKPEYIINCAGTVENSEKALQINPVFTLNLLQTILENNIKLQKIILTGSAGEYGVVGGRGLPVNEDAPLLGESFYARSKVIESSVALYFRKQYELPITVARIFNPIGSGMHPRFLIPGVIRQLNEYKLGKKKSIEVNRLDAFRDYIDVSDIGEALIAICKNNNSSAIYNIGSGKKITNSELIDLIIEKMNVKPKPKIIETQENPEPIYAVQADITKITNDTNWKPKIKLSDTIEKIVSDYEK